MNQNKTLVTLAIASIVLLMVSCACFFWVAWSSMSSVEQLREENHRLTLESTVCSLRLENTVGQNGRGYATPNSAESLQLTPAAPVSKGSAVSLDNPALARRSMQVQTPVKKTEPVVKKAEPAVSTVVMQLKPEQKSLPAPAASATRSTEEVAFKPIQVATPKSVETPASAETVATVPVARVWGVQAGAFATKSVAEEGACEIREALEAANLKDVVLIGKGKGAFFWKVVVHPCATREEAEKASKTLMPVLGDDLFAIRLPRSLREGNP